MMKQEIIKPFSIHTFMYPFKWIGTIGEKEKEELSWITDKFKEKGWKRNLFEIRQSIHYKEFVYFQPFIQKSIFDLNEDNENVRYMEFPISKDAVFEFKATDYSNDYKISLALKRVSVHLFFTGVGILTFQLKNYQSNDKSFVKYINDFGRRTYPQFLTDNTTGRSNFDYAESVKKAFLPEYIRVKFRDGFIVEETFEIKSLPKINQNVIQSAKYISKILPESESIKPLNDDRMFVVCWYGNNYLSLSLKQYEAQNNKYAYMSSDEWYALMFCDKGYSTCQSNIMREEHLKKYTYDRWVNYETLYGITRDCLFCLSSDWQTLKKNDATYIVENNYTVYYQMAVICLAQRASVNTFSCLLSELDSEKRDDVTYFQKRYFRFNNRMYVNEITAQIQGIEMYRMMQQAMKIDEDARRLDREIEELHNLLDMENNNKMNTEMLKLTTIATYFVPFSIVLTLLSIFINNALSEKIKVCPLFFASILVVFSGLLCFGLIKWIKNKLK